MTGPKLIGLLGAECTGKTTLARQLAQRCNCAWVGEYLRTFCAEQGRTPTREEQQHILRTQVRHEEKALEQAHQRQQAYVFCDTAPLLTAIYSEYIFSDTSLYAQARAWHARYSLTLLLTPDIAWQADGLQRDGAHVRAPIHALLQRELGTLAGPTVCISGNGDLRLESALHALEGL